RSLLQSPTASLQSRRCGGCCSFVRAGSNQPAEKATPFTVCRLMTSHERVITACFGVRHLEENAEAGYPRCADSPWLQAPVPARSSHQCVPVGPNTKRGSSRRPRHCRYGHPTVGTKRHVVPDE